MPQEIVMNVVLTGESMALIERLEALRTLRPLFDEDAAKEIDRLRKENETADTLLAEARERDTKRLAEIDRLRKNVERLQAENAAANDAIDNLRDENDRMHQDNMTMRAALETIASEGAFSMEYLDRSGQDRVEEYAKVILAKLERGE